MARSKFGLLGLCAVVFGVMAFGATAAQATAGAQWLLAKSTGELITFLPAAVIFETDKTIIWHSTFNKGKSKVLIECNRILAVNAKLLANGSIGEATGAVKGSKVKFSECKTLLDGKAAAACEPNAGGKEKGVLNTVTLHGLIVLNAAKEERVQVLPDSGETLLFNETSEECAFGAKVPIFGTLFFKDCEGLFLTHLLKHLWEVDNELSKLFFVNKENPLTILGSWWAFLAGEHLGLRWSGDPA